MAIHACCHESCPFPAAESIQICNLFKLFGRSIRNSLPWLSRWEQHSCVLPLFLLMLCKTTLYSAWGISLLSELGGHVRDERKALLSPPVFYPGELRVLHLYCASPIDSGVLGS
jgi:hypothetical protein